MKKKTSLYRHKWKKWGKKTQRKKMPKHSFAF